MYSVKIYGAGSIGNHIAHAFRNLDWNVSICDTDPDALKRTRTEIYPSRYGRWDDRIELASVEELSRKSFDVVVVGTPPDSHMDILMEELQRGDARAILVEKPLCGPGLEGCTELVNLARKADTFVCVGYNHVLTRNSTKAAEFIRDGELGEPQTIGVTWVEHWGGIFAAHPWLAGPGDSYLGDSSRGGGACAEHSHGINIWQHFAHLLGVGRIIEVSAVMERVQTSDVSYDRIAQLSVVTETGLTGYIIQDVVTRPPRKQARIQGENGALEWDVNIDPQHDSVRFWTRGEWRDEMISKSRIDDFAAEASHLRDIVEGKVTDSPIGLERGLETMMVIAAAHQSAQEGRRVSVDYKIGYTPEAIS